MSQDEIGGIHSSVYSIDDINNLNPHNKAYLHSCSLDYDTSIKRKYRSKAVITVDIDEDKVSIQTGFIHKKAVLAYVVLIHNRYMK